MTYQQFLPSPPLHQIVKSIWLLEDEDPADTDFDKIFPDGSAELILHFGDPMLSRTNGMTIVQERSFVYGQLIRHIELKPTGKVGVIGVKFHPFGLSLLTRIPQFEIKSLQVSLRDVFHDADPFLEEKILAEPNIESRIRMVEKFLMHVLNRSSRHHTDQVRRLSFAVSSLSEGNKTISEIAYTLNITTRELERRFAKHVGMSPKKLAGIYQFQSLFSIWPKVNSLTELAYAAGYYDQAHFIRSFREISGTTPQSFFKKDNPLTELFVAKS